MSTESVTELSAMTISEAAREVGRTAHTLRYYEDIGLVPGVRRTRSGHRRYTTSQVRWLRFLDRLRETGMPIARMREYARLAARGKGTLPERYELLQQHQRDLEEQVTALHGCLAALEKKMGFFQDAGSNGNARHTVSPEDACLSHTPCGERQ